MIMHYVRLLKPPALFPDTYKTGQSWQVSTKITITTDLGDSFLLLPLPLAVFLLDSRGHPSPFQSYEWKGGSRHLEINLGVDRKLARELNWPCRLVVRPAQEGRRWEAGEEARSLIVTGDQEGDGKVLGVESEPIPLEAGREVDRRVRREVAVVGGAATYISEEMGESIARHIWDAGLILSALLLQLATSSGSSFPNSFPFSPAFSLLHKALLTHHLRVIELGTGVGIVGHAVARSLPAASIILTDLAEAEEIVRYNISQSGLSNLSYQNLDWSSPLPQNLRTQKFDMVLVSDCTYNPDVVPELVGTLRRITHTSPAVLIVVAMKVRHESESVFFTYMMKNHLTIVDKALLPLPHLGEEDQEIEIYFFKARGVHDKI